MLLALALLLGCMPAFADQFYFTRMRALADAQEGATGLFLWNDATGAQTQIGGSGAAYLRHATDGAQAVGGIATNASGTLYGFAVDDTANAGLLPFTTSCASTLRSRLVTINTSTAVITYVGPYLASRGLFGAGFDGQGRLWALDCVSGNVIRIDPATGGIVGTPIAAGITTFAADIDFAANGLGIIGYGGLAFRVVNPDAGWVADVPIVAQNSGFDGTLQPPYAIVGVAFTNHLSARNGSPAAQDCRLNLQEHRGLDELGHANDPFFANPLIARREAEALNPASAPAGWFNGGPGDIARVGGPALSSCFFDWGDAPASYGTLRANNGARHSIAGPYLGAALPDFEVDGQAGPATGDNNTGTDDETGVIVPTLTRGETVAIDVTVGGQSAGTRLQGWIDWDADGSFAQPGDQILADATVVAGINTFNVNVPIAAAVGTTYARFRIADQAGLSFNGAAASGEVEDYAILITAGQPLLAKAFNASSIPYGGSATLTFTIDNTAAGAIDQSGMGFTDNLAVGLMIATPANVINNCTGATVTANAGASTITVSGASVLAGQTCTISVDVTNRPGYTGICFDPNFANENQNITGLNNLAAAIAQFTCLSVEPPDCPDANYTNGFDNIGGLSPNLNNGVSGQCLVLTPTITLNKISEAGTGSFGFTFGNTDAVNPVTIVTTAPSVPVAAGPFNVLDMAQPVTIAETGLPAGWVLAGIACVTDGGDGIGSFDAGSATWTAAPGELASGQEITCTAINLAPAAVGIVKTLTGQSGSDPAVAEPGEQLTYTITLTNTGGVDAVNYPVTDVLDPNVTFVSADNGGALVGGNVEWTGLTVPAGGNLVLTVVVQVVNPIPAGVTAIGNVAYTPTDPPPNCSVTPTPPNCTGIPTPDPIDFGDAPDSYGTLLASNGARHAVPNLNVGANTAPLMLGTTIDTEADGVPGAAAQGDDTAGIDDENAVGTMPDIAVTQTVYTVSVAVRNTTGAAADLVGWVDWNRDGVFDAGEAATATVANGATSATLNWTGVSIAPLVGTTYARLRIAPPGQISASTPTGFASAGEVEDYTVQLYALPDPFSACPVNNLPPPTDFTIRQRWATPDVAGRRVLAYETPIVGDLFGTGQPAVVIASDNSYAGGGNPERVAKDLHIYNGQDGSYIRTITTPLFNWAGHAVAAIADVTGDGQGEIVLKVSHQAAVPAAQRSRLIAYRNDGTQLWVSNQTYDYAETNGRGGMAIGFADFNGDGVPEVYVGTQIFNARTGVRLAVATAASSSGCPHRAEAVLVCLWGQATAADMDGDGLLELVAGNVVYKVNITNPNGQAGNTLTVWQQAAAAAGVGDGLTAVADMDLDGTPDVIVIRTVDGLAAGATRLYVWNGQTSTVMAMVANVGIAGGAPLIGDIDGDGTPEVVFANRVSAAGNPTLRAFRFVPGTGLVPKWTLATNDTSALTSLAMFDFNNDRRQELVYRDETHLRIIDGSGASAIDFVNFPCTSGTGLEMPVIAALDATRQARILVTCGTAASGAPLQRGVLRAFETNSFPWASTRPVWNQQAYFVTHVNNDLTIPSNQYPHWTAFSDPGQLCSDGINRPLNAFQQQVTDLDPNSGCPAVCATADVQASKALTGESGALPGLAEAGEQLTYTITLTNIGGLDATNFAVTDQLDPNVTFVSASHGGTLVGGNVEWSGLTVPGAGSLQLTIVVQVVDPIPAGVTQIGNVVYNTGDPPPDCNVTPLPPTCTSTPTPDPIDFGDAPDSYGTLLASNGARHVVPNLDFPANTAPLMLGATIDTEPNGLPSADAQGDDTDVVDDEDAVATMPDMAVTQTAYTVTVAVTNSTGAVADLVGWVDWNRNGVFDSTEAATAIVANGATSATLSWTGVSLSPLVGTTYARLRIAPAGELDASTPIGEASAGEVEDHVVRLIELPDPFASCPVNDLPPPTNFTIQERWRTPNTAGLRTLPYQTPVVGDLFGTGEIVAVVASDDNFIGNTAQPNATASGLRIVRGSNGAVIGTIATPRFNWFGHSVVAIADVDGDGVGEVFMKSSHHDEVAAANRGRLFAYKYNGTTWNQWWVSNVRYDYNNDSANTANNRRSGHSLSIADFNGDGIPEIFIGNQVFNARTGVRLVARGATDPAGCVLATCIQGSTAAVDMDGDGVLELIAGNVVYKVDITNPNAATGNTITIWQQASAVAAMGDGFTSVADIDLDGDPDVVIVRSSGGTNDNNAHLFVWDGQTSAVLGAVHANPLGTQGSQPMVGDIDGDGIPEIVFVTANQLNAYKYVSGTGLVQKWQTATNDASGQTSFALFDFNSDGRKELVYRDETNLRIIDGSGAAAVNVATFPCFSGTRAEMPVVAALDNTREARILVTCSTTNTVDFNARGSLRAYQTASFPWASTRPVWNQQTYFVTHINNNLTVPSNQYPHWTAFNDPGQLCSDGITRPLNAFQQQISDLDPNTGCPSVCATANVEVVKQLTGENGTQPGIAEPGEQLTYTITLTNSGGLDSTNYSIIDLLDANVTFVSADNGGTLVGNEVHWTGLTVPAAGTLVLTVVVQVVDPIPDGVTSIGNVAYDPEIGPPDCTSDPLPPRCTITPTPDPLDFGDAPDSYGTLLASGGARHLLVDYDHVSDTAPLMIGALVDQETDGVPGVDATGDDDNGIDDEDAFFGPIALQPGATAVSLDVPVTNTTGGDANLYAWIDFNGNGVFDVAEAGNCPVVADAATQVACAWAALAPLPDGFQTYARLRLTTQTLPAGTAPNGGDARAQGLANDGEVEDHRVAVATVLPLTCEAPFVETFGSYPVAPGAAPGWGTALPAGTTTYAFQPGPSFVNEAEYALVTTSILGNPAWQNAPDHTPGDTDGFMMIVNGSASPGVFYRRTFSGLAIGARYNFFASLANIVAGFNLGLPDVTLRVIDPATNTVLASFDTGGLPEGPAGTMPWQQHQLVFTATQNTVRIELANNSGVLAGNDLALDDIGFAQVCELGDAPDSYGTLNASNGAGHLFPGPGLSLGGGVPDGELDGQPSAGADGDDLNGIDDENAFPSGAPSLVIGAPYALSAPVETTAGDATACAWVDLDQNGSFSAAEGQCQPLAAGAATVDFTWTGADTAGLASGSTYLRMRIERNGTYPANLSTSDFLGARGPGEVEDYVVTVLTPATVEIVKDLTGENGSLPDVAEAGEQLTYTITLTNAGGVPAINYSVIDQLDPNVTFVSADNGGTLVGGNVEWTGLTVPAGGTLVLTVVVQVVDPIPDGVLAIGNVAYDPITGPPDCDEVPTPPNCTSTPTEPNVSPSKALTGENGALPGIAEPGEQLTYTITLTNTGGTDDANYALIDQLDPNVVFVSADNGGVLVGDQVQWTGLTVPANGTLVLTVVVQVAAPIPDGVASIGNVVYNPIDPPPNCAVTPTPPNCTVTPTPPLLRVEKSIIAESMTMDGIAEAGEELTYSIRVRNVGGTDALNRIVNEIVPANTVYVALGSDAWSCADGSGPGTPCDFTIATVPAGGFVDLLFRVRIDDPIPAGVTQIANAVALDGDPPPTCPPNAGDPQDPACAVIPTEPQTVVAKALTGESLGQNGQAEAGEVLTYTITVTNHGGSDHANVVVNEIVPDYTTTAPGNQTVNGALGSWTCADGAGPGAACNLTLALVPAGGSVTVQFLVRVDSPIPPGVTQIANAVALNGDPPPPCPPAGGQCVITPTEPSVSVIKTLLLEDGTQDDVAEAGETLVYQLTVTNTGGSAALAEFLREIVPQYTIFVADPVSSPGWTCADGSPNPTVCDLTFDIGPLQTLNFLFAVEVADPIPDGVTQIANGIGHNGNPPPCPPPGVHCVVTPTANLDTDKTIVSVTPVGANSYRVTYRIVVTNTGGAPGAYTLVDELGYPAAGVTLLSPAIASTADGVLEPTIAANNGQYTPVNNTPVQLSDIDVALAPGEADTYTVAITIAVDPSQVSNGACTGTPGNGLYNSAMVVGTDEDGDDACVPVPSDAPRIDLVKRNTLRDGNANGYGDVGELLEYTFEIANSGSTSLSTVRLIDAKIRPPQGAWVQCDRPGTPGSGSYAFADPVEAGGTITCTATYALTATDVSVRRVTNTATVTGVAPDGRQVRASHTSIFENFQ